MTDMQITVGLRREPGMNLTAVLPSSKSCVMMFCTKFTGNTELALSIFLTPF
jgi:hypothetical protein